MTYIFINAASLVGQAQDLHQAGQLLNTMMETYDDLKKICVQGHSLYRDEPLENKQIVEGNTFRNVVDFRRKQIDEAQEQQAAAVGDVTPERERFGRFTRDIARCPIAVQEFGHQKFECLLESEEVQYKAIGYTAHFTSTLFEGTAGTAAMLSMHGCATYSSARIEVLYASDTDFGLRQVWNLTQRQDVADVRRNYAHNPKHSRATVVDEMIVSEMDLCGEDAQRLLHRATTLEGERRLFARHNGRVYIFPCHDEARREYHGFPVEPAEMKRRMRSICDRLYKCFGWEEFKP